MNDNSINYMSTFLFVGVWNEKEMKQFNSLSRLCLQTVLFIQSFSLFMGFYCHCVCEFFFWAKTTKGSSQGQLNDDDDDDVDNNENCVMNVKKVN